MPGELIIGAHKVTGPNTDRRTRLSDWLWFFVHYLSPRHSFGPKALYIDSLISSQVVTSSTPTCPPHYFMKLSAESPRPQTATSCAPRTPPAGLGCGNQAPSATSWQQWVTWRVLASGAQLDFPLVVILYNNMFSVTNIFILYVTETGRTF